jgi:alanine-synthesizing transaminase
VAPIGTPANVIAKLNEAVRIAVSADDMLKRFGPIGLELGSSTPDEFGSVTPIQVASIVALDGPQDCVEDIRQTYQRRRDVMVKGLHDIGWMVDNPKASMYVWAKIPDYYSKLGSIEFTKKLLEEAKIAVAPGIGFGDHGDDHVRIALIENENRLRQALRGVKEMFRKDGLLRGAA